MKTLNAVTSAAFNKEKKTSESEVRAPDVWALKALKKKVGIYQLL